MYYFLIGQLIYIVSQFMSKIIKAVYLIVFVVYIILKTKISFLNLLWNENSTYKHAFTCVILREVYGINVFPIGAYIPCFYFYYCYWQMEYIFNVFRQNYFIQASIMTMILHLTRSLSVLMSMIDINCFIIGQEYVSSLTLWFSSNSRT